MACGSCGGGAARTKYEVTFNHDSSKKTFDTIAEARLAIAASPKGGTRKAVAAK